MHPVIDAAIEIFGVTDSPWFAGYILPDGQMLNFSGGGYQRDLDHRDISQAWDELEWDMPECPMDAFERLGAIRFSRYDHSVNVSVNTYQYINALQEDTLAFCCADCCVTVDLYNDRGNSTACYYFELYEEFHPTFLNLIIDGDFEGDDEEEDDNYDDDEDDDDSDL